MTDPLQYLRDRRLSAVARAAPQAVRRATPAPSPGSNASFLDPQDLPALALSILAEGRATHAPPAAERLNLQRRRLPDGGQCSLPIRYFAARCVIAAFRIEGWRAREALPDGMAPVLDGDFATALWGCFEYRDSDLGPYNEVGLSIPAVAPDDAAPALCVLHLPVTTAETDRIGRELWGYPKFVAGIDIHGDARAFSTALRDPAGSLIAVFEGAASSLTPSPASELPTYSRLGGQLLRTRIEALTPFQEGDGGGFRLSVGPSAHPMAQTLRALGLDCARPQSVRYADPFQAMLFPGFPL